MALRGFVVPVRKRVVGRHPYTLCVLLHEVSTSRLHPTPPPLGEGAGLLPSTGGGWEGGGICANLTKQYTYALVATLAKNRKCSDQKEELNDKGTHEEQTRASRLPPVEEQSDHAIEQTDDSPSQRE